MLSHDIRQQRNLFEESYETLKDPERGYNRGDAICGALGLLVLVLMLLIATGTVPLYDWKS
jgi:hypothetical protein